MQFKLRKLNEGFEVLTYTVLDPSDAASCAIGTSLIVLNPSEHTPIFKGVTYGLVLNNSFIGSDVLVGKVNSFEDQSAAEAGGDESFAGLKVTGGDVSLELSKADDFLKAFPERYKSSDTLSSIPRIDQFIKQLLSPVSREDLWNDSGKYCSAALSVLIPKIYNTVRSFAYSVNEDGEKVLDTTYGWLANLIDPSITSIPMTEEQFTEFDHLIQRTENAAYVVGRGPKARQVYDDIKHQTYECALELCAICCLTNPTVYVPNDSN